MRRQVSEKETVRISSAFSVLVISKYSLRLRNHKTEG